MNYIEAIILAVIEGITEFLPISSTGHLVLAAEFLKIPQTDFVKNFEITIQLGAILAVISMYFKTAFLNKKILARVIAAFIPTGIIGFIFYNFVKHTLLGNTEITLAALFFGGAALIMLEFFYREKEHVAGEMENVTLRQAFMIGIFQSFSIIPGVSRAAATIAGGLLLGLKRKTAVEFSFLLAIPTMAAAAGFDLLKSNLSFTGNEGMLMVIGFAGAFISARMTVTCFLRFIQHHTFIPFGIYRIALAIVFWFLVVS
ncbi:MAG: undecaprenyl-diphosphate phosphatase [Candidatus Sungbacteria bacterium]|nr:undecaprenyl-diphosphate phosphatase [Candidatus Sungbacteria bacterium]